MAKLVLVKHSAPEIVPDVPAPRWVLSERGRARCAWLADELACVGITRLFTSLEPKALETAALVAARNGLVVEPRDGLHENNRSGMGFLPEAELRDRIRLFLTEPTRSVMGTETANSACERFSSAIAAIEAEARGQDIAVVTHGTVLTLFVDLYNAVARFELWSSLKTPSYVVLESDQHVFGGAAVNFTGAD